MPKIIAAMNITLDGFCDHTAGIADDEVHEHYNDLLRSVDTIIYGRTAYQLMESYWPVLVKTPSGNTAEDDFAVLIDNIHKIVYSRSLTDVTWKNSTLKREIIPAEVMALKSQFGKDILVGSPSLIDQFTQLGLVDEFQLNLNPVILGKGKPLFKTLQQRVDLKLIKTKTFQNGSVVMYLQPTER